MHVHTQGVSRERPDFVRSAERCWIDGDLIRLSSWPIGGIRPYGRRGPVPWLITSYMMKPQDGLGGLSPREWLRGRPIEDHIEMGMRGLRETGVLKR
jgi:hypothetical protein